MPGYLTYVSKKSNCSSFGALSVWQVITTYRTYCTMESHAVPTLWEIVLHRWMSLPSADLPALKNQKTKVLMSELSQHARWTGHFGSRGALCVLVLGKLRAEERDRKIHLNILIGTCQGKGSSDLDNREKNAVTFIIFYFTVFSFRAWHSAIFPSVKPTYSNLYVKPTLIIFCIIGKIHKMMETIRVKSQKNLQKKWYICFFVQ